MKQEDVNLDRISYIDSLKGIAVLLVVFGHCWTFQKQFAVKLIMAFHMPLFFFISGYLFKYTDTYKRDAICVIIAKGKHLLIPYFIFEGFNLVVSLLIRPYYGNLIHESMVIQSIVLCLNTPDYEGVCSRLWFLPATFVSSIYMLFVLQMRRYYNTTINKYCLSSALVLFCLDFAFHKIVFQRLPFTMDISIMATAYMLLGFAFKEKVDLCTYQKKRKLCVVGSFSFFALCVCVKFNPEYFSMYLDRYGAFGVAVLGSFFGIIMTITFVLGFNIRNRFLIWLGKNSLVIFPLHLEILFFLKWIVKSFFSTGIAQYAFCGYFPLCLLILFPIVQLVNKYCPILNGK